MTNKAAWFAVAGTILLTIYGQIVIKWRVGGLSLTARDPLQKLFTLLRLFLDPWIMTALAGAVLASLCWMAAMTRLPLGSTYPFTSLSFLLVMIIGIVFF